MGFYFFQVLSHSACVGPKKHDHNTSVLQIKLQYRFIFSLFFCARLCSEAPTPSAIAATIFNQNMARTTQVDNWTGFDIVLCFNNLNGFYPPKGGGNLSHNHVQKRRKKGSVRHLNLEAECILIVAFLEDFSQSRRVWRSQAHRTCDLLPCAIEAIIIDQFCGLVYRQDVFLSVLFWSAQDHPHRAPYQPHLINKIWLLLPK